MTRSRRSWLIAVVAALAISACSATPSPSSAPGSSPGATTPPATEAKLTEEQRGVLSQILQKNFEAGGATIAVTLPGGASTMTAEIDWTRSLGHATAVNDGRTVEFYFGLGEVLDGTIPGLTEAVAANGQDGVRFVARVLDPTYSTLDQVSALLLGLANERRENPVALADQDVAYLGRRDVEGKAVDVYRFGSNTTYLVEPDGGTMVGVDARFKSFDGVVEVRIESLGPREVRGPKSGEVIQGADIADLYRELAGKPLPASPSTSPAPPTSSPASRTAPS